MSVTHRQRPLGAHSPELREVDPGEYVPLPPTDEEKYSYYGRQGRWIWVVFLAAFVGIMYGTARMALNSMWTSWLYELVALQVATVAICFVSSITRRRSTRAEHDDLVASYRPHDYPSVDIFLPSCGEPLHILENTFRHVRALDWPGSLAVYVLDDSARGSVADFAARYGFTYHSRPNRGHLKKAGNLRYGLERSGGDLVHIFDADFAPRPDMVRELAPYFDDPSVGIVQSPQFFDTQEDHFNWLQKAAGATQELFYRWIQPARDAAEAAICVGTNAVYRRAALEAAGGFAQIEHSEDVHTGINLDRVGYLTRYVPVNLAKGLSPGNFEGFANQQYRWCNGSLSLLADADFHRHPMTVRQRLCHWTGFLYYLSSALAAFAAPLPSLIMILFFSEQIRPSNYLPLIGAVFIWTTLMPRITNYRWSPASVRVQILIDFCHAVAMFDFIRGRTAAWVPTGAADKTPTAKRVLRLLRFWLITTQGLTWAGIAFCIVKFGIDQMWATVLFSAPLLYFVFPLLLGNRATPERKPRVGTLRQDAPVPAQSVRREPALAYTPRA